jgi:hypothetical protein
MAQEHRLVQSADRPGRFSRIGWGPTVRCVWIALSLVGNQVMLCGSACPAHAADPQAAPDRRSAIGHQRSTVSHQPTAERRQPTADSRQPTADPFPVNRPIIPLSPDGGVLMLPLTPDRPGDWPASVSLTLADGRSITGVVISIAPAPVRLGAGWTDSPLGVEVITSAARNSGDARAARATPFLLAELPPDAPRGTISILNHTLHPRWIAVPDHNDAAAASDRSERRTDVLVRRARRDRPDPDHPMEYWRWVLLADRLGMAPPPPPGARDADPSSRLIAEHTALLWRAGLDRIRRQSSGMADHLRDLLTRICYDGETAFAAWIADPASLNALLNTLLNDELDGAALLRRVIEWSDTHERLMVWLESATDQYVDLAMVNPTFRPIIARVRWADPDEIPLAYELPAGRLTRVRFDRQGETSTRQNVKTSSAPSPEPSPRVLLVEVPGAPDHGENQTFALVVHPPRQPVAPPGLFLPELTPMLTLASVQQGQPLTAPARYETSAQLRRLHGRWEVFIAAHRPAQGGAALRTDLSQVTTTDDLRGKEAITLFLGSGELDDPDRIVLAVAESGEYRFLHGVDHLDLRIHRRSFSDRWHCRIVLPDDWLTDAEESAIHLGLMRTFRDLGAVVSTPMPAVPWRIEPGRLTFDLSVWDDVPGAREAQGAK